MMIRFFLLESRENKRMSLNIMCWIIVIVLKSGDPAAICDLRRSGLWTSMRCNYFGRLVGESLLLYMHIEHQQEYVVVVVVF